jgi:hypothetical protein
MLAFLKTKPLPEPKEIPRHEIEAPIAPPVYSEKGRGKGQAVGDSNDLRRVLALRRREVPSEKYLSIIAADLKQRLGRVRTAADGPCECSKIKPYAKYPCADTLKSIQAMALHEGEEVGGLLGPIGVGHGKTLLDLLMPMVVGGKTWVLLLPPQLKSQLLEVDWNYYSQHWHLPNLVSGKWYTPGRPFLHVIAFSELSGAKNTDLLERLDPDGILVDEAHSVRNRTAARTKRFLRFLDKQTAPTYVGKRTKLFCWSGTLTARSLKDYAHLAEHSLGGGSPVPLHWPTVEEWAAHLDPSEFRAPAGALARLSEVVGQPRREVEDARDLFRGALVRTPGVVSSGDAASCQASLVISERVVSTPPKVQLAINTLEATWQRPDEEELVDALSKARCARELSCGFYYQWRWPKRGGEAQRIPIIDKWKAARKEWHKELRDKLKHGGAHMDSPLLCLQAAIRWHDGYVYVEKDEDGNEKRRYEIPPKSSKGPRPTWNSTFWPLWKEVRNTAFPETEAVWIDDFLVQDSLKWLSEGPGVLWYEFSAFAARLVARRGAGAFTLAGPGEDGNRVVRSLTGREAVVASIRAHGTGKNLQQFARAHVANPPSDGATWEQLLGRHHRTGQEADEVTFSTYRHTEAFRAAVEKARDLSEYIEGTLGTTQRLASIASWGF